ncbi:MAG: tetratricopeptide repeat protein [Deltaproteobacteria bacterium]|nr:MAG: tetratricopeptide repeat protein [Deltaproteobacteria bacterium]
MSRIRSTSSWVRVATSLALAGWWQAEPLAVTYAAPPLGSAGIQLTPDEAREACLTEVSSGSPVDEAIRVDQARARTLPTKPDGWVRVGWEWVRKARLSGDPGFYVNVASCTDAALRVSPENTAARELRGLVLINGHRFEEARQEAEKILAADPENPIALGTLSDALLELGRFEEAVAAAQRSADVKPGPVLYARASYFRWLTGDTDGAKRFIRSALSGRDRRDPEPTAWTFVEAAKVFWHEADYDGADALLAEALRWVPDYPPALVARGRVALSQGQPDRAIGFLEKAYRAQPLPETAWLLADARAMLRDVAGAEAESQRVVQAGRRGDRLTLALFYATKNRAIDEALRLIEEERAGRGGVYVDDTYAWVLYRAGRIEEARRASDSALRLGTPDARILYHAGAIQMAAAVPAGRTLVEKALAINPKFDVTGAAEARALLASTSDRTDAATQQSRRVRPNAP